jgi:hypothetical protein
MTVKEAMEFLVRLLNIPQSYAPYSGGGYTLGAAYPAHTHVTNMNLERTIAHLMQIAGVK